jgi:hypothetical protein
VYCWENRKPLIHNAVILALADFNPAFLGDVISIGQKPPQNL